MSDRGKKSAYSAEDEEKESRSAFRACACMLLRFRCVAGVPDFLGAIPVGCPLARHSVGCVYLRCGPPVEERRTISDQGKNRLTMLRMRSRNRGVRFALARICSLASAVWLGRQTF